MGIIILPILEPRKLWGGEDNNTASGSARDELRFESWRVLSLTVMWDLVALGKWHLSDTRLDTRRPVKAVPEVQAWC